MMVRAVGKQEEPTEKKIRLHIVESPIYQKEDSWLYLVDNEEQQGLSLIYVVRAQFSKD